MGRKRRFKPVLPRRLHTVCTYCGAKADSRDHYVCWAISESPYWLPACRDCNVRLGFSRQETLSERAAALKRSLKKSYDKILRSDYDALLEGTEGNLRRKWIAEQSVQNEVERKLDWLATIEGLVLDLFDLHEDPELPIRVLDNLDRDLPC